MHHTKYKIKFYKACRRIQYLHNRLFAVHNFYNMEALVKKKCFQPAILDVKNIVEVNMRHLTLIFWERNNMQSYNLILQLLALKLILALLVNVLTK